MKNKLALLCFTLINSISFANESISPFAPVQFEKGYICGLEVGHNIRELIYDGADVKVERYMVEGIFYLRYHFNIEHCGIVSVELDNDDVAFRLSTTLTEYTTKDGANVGMTLRQLKEIYPEAELMVQIGDHEILQTYSFSIDGLGVFTIDASSIMNKCGDEYPNCEEYMHDLKSVNFFTY